NESSLFVFNPDVEMRNFGFAYCIITVPLPFLFFLVIKALYLKNRETANMTFKLMNIINCSQLVQSITHFLTGPGLIFPNIQKRYGLFVNIVGCTMNTFWIADFPMISLLAVSRILVFTNRIKTTRFPKPMKVLIFLSWSWIAFVLIYGCATQNLIFVSPGWDYDFSVPYAEFFSNLEITLSLSCLAISYTSYISIAFLIYKAKNLKSSVASRRNEISILFQSTFVTGYISMMIYVSHPAYFPMFQFIEMNDQTNQALLNYMWILHCYVNPCMLLVFNK
ncbi:Protein CBG06786, partial [Caenorhabditis briggsae]